LGSNSPEGNEEPLGGGSSGRDVQWARWDSDANVVNQPQPVLLPQLEHV
jgi:hypothetical protein